MRDKVNASFVERNREHIKVVLDVVLFLCQARYSVAWSHRKRGCIKRIKGNFFGTVPFAFNL